MDIQATQSPPFEPDSPSGHRTEVIGLRIYSKQKEQLNREYNGTASTLARILFQQYFAGALPTVEQEYKKVISR